MIKKTILLTIAVLLGSLDCVAQNDTLWTLSGKVVDAKGKKPMAYVSVTDRQVGTVTNSEGEFTLKLKQRPDRVSFSCLGYKTRRIAASELEAQKPLVVALTASSVVLDDIIVSAGGDARAIVEKAVEKIDVNYPTVPNLFKGFYRETVQKRRRFFSIAEGVVDVYKSGYRRLNWHDGVAILKGRRLLSQRRGDTLSVKLQGGPVLPIELDVVKQREMLFDSEEIDNYSFRFLHSKKADEEAQYAVEVIPQVNKDYPLWKGVMYIDQKTLAFTRIELELDMRDTEKVTRSILRKKPVGLRFTPHEMSIFIDYKTDDGLTRMNYIRNVIRFRCDWKRKLFKSNYTVTSELVMTDRKDGPDIKPIRVRDTFNRKDNFYDKVIYFEDPDFWGDENIIEPTEDLLEGIGKIKAALKR